MARVSKQKVLKGVRRVHLYLGLTLVPWILLYGATALLFNHSGWLSSRAYWNTGPVAMSELPSPEFLARDAVGRMAPGIDLVEGSVQWLGHVSFSGETATHHARVSVHPDGSGGLLRTSPRTEDPPAWAGALADWSPVDEAAERSIVARALAAANAQGAELDALTLRRYPTLRFDVLDGEQTYAVELELDGELAVEPAGSATLRGRLLRLHTAHGSPGYVGVRWFWARIVDVMGLAMLAWGVTGLLMWWQIRPTRRVGGIALGLGMGTMLVMAVLVWTAMGL